MKRKIIAGVIVFLLLGAIVNVAVAWGFAAFLAEQKDGWTSSRAGVAALDEVHVWAAWRLERLGYIKIHSHLDGPPPQWDDRWEDPRALGETWSLVPSASEMGKVWRESASGWPYVCLWSRLNLLDPRHLVVLPRKARILPLDTVEMGFVVSDRVLPLGPIWPGFAINTLFYAAILWAMFATPFALRRRRRLKRGLCPTCAYPIGNSPVCTECGKPVQPRRGVGV